MTSRNCSGSDSSSMGPLYFCNAFVSSSFGAICSQHKSMSKSHDQPHPGSYPKHPSVLKRDCAAVQLPF
jgi:hypothetical protein